MTQAQMDILLGELFEEIDDVYSLHAELDLLEYLDDVGYESFLESEVA